MPTTRQDGSILMLVMAIVITLSLLVFAFLRVMQLHAEDGIMINKQLLAREAAQDGVNHAIEVIIKDFCNTDATGQSGPTNTVMDSPSRAAFLVHLGPYGVGNPNYYPGGAVEPEPSWQIGWDDTPYEHLLVDTQNSAWWYGYQASIQGAYPYGVCTSDGRGRYLEPEFYNLPAPFPATSASIWPNIAPAAITGSQLPGTWTPSSTPASISYTQNFSLAPMPAIPQRPGNIPGDDGNFYDQHWHQIGGDPRVARFMARYRMRYAITVNDLDGELVTNPDPGYLDSYVDSVPTDAGHGWTAMPKVASTNPSQANLDLCMARIIRGQHAFRSITMNATGYVDATGGVGFNGGGDSHNGIGPDGPAHMEHVYLGRGFTCNFDQDPAHMKMAPQTFPLMYRCIWPTTNGIWYGTYYDSILPNGPLDATGNPIVYNSVDATLQPGFNGYSLTFPNPVYNNPDGGRLPAANLFQTPNGGPAPVVTGLMGGGEQVPAQDVNTHFLMGPQYSFKNLEMSIYGTAGERWDSNSAGIGQGDYDDAIGVPWDMYTPFGRGLTATSAAGATPTRASAKTDTPWCVNVMTAPPRVLFGMIGAYMPPGVIHVLYQDNYPSPSSTGLATTAQAIFGQGGGNSNCAPLYGQNDLFVATQNPAFALWQPPFRPALGPNPAITPDYRVPYVLPSDNTTSSVTISPGITTFKTTGAPPTLNPPSNITTPPSYNLNNNPPSGGFRGPTARYPGTLCYNGYFTGDDATSSAVAPPAVIPIDGYSIYQGTVTAHIGPNPPNATTTPADQVGIVDFSAGGGQGFPPPQSATAPVNTPISPYNFLNTPPWVTFIGDCTTPASATASVSATGAVTIYVTSPGSGYTQPPQVLLTTYLTDPLGTHLRTMTAPPNEPATTPLPGESKVTFQHQMVINPNNPNGPWGTAQWDAAGDFDPYSDFPVWTHGISNYWGQGSISAHMHVFLNAPGAPVADTQGSSTTIPHIPNCDYSITGPHPNSIWDAIGQAMGAAIMVAKVGNQRYSTSTCNVAKVFNDLTGYSGSVGVTDSSKLPQVKSMADLDAVFLANLGIDINHPHNPPPAPIPAFFSNVAFPLGGAWNALWYEEILDFNPLYNIANEPPLPGYSMQQQQAISELILNDFRMSFFGASPDYPNFTPLDFDGDGTVYCSCYPSSGIASEVALGLSQHAPVVLGVPTAPTNYFSNTGCFFIGKSHFWRIRARGEVWDNVTNKTLSEGLLDTVLCVDPADANQADPLPNPAGGQWSTHVIYQRWWYDLYRGLMSRKL